VNCIHIFTISTLYNSDLNKRTILGPLFLGRWLKPLPKTHSSSPPATFLISFFRNSISANFCDRNRKLISREPFRNSRGWGIIEGLRMAYRAPNKIAKSAKNCNKLKFWRSVLFCFLFLSDWNVLVSVFQVRFLMIICVFSMISFVSPQPLLDKGWAWIATKNKITKNVTVFTWQCCPG
jgi:hypothetical protein